MKKTAATILVLVFSFLGLANSAYLSQSEANGTPLLCNIANLSGCNIVASSPFSHIFGVSLANWGLIFYGLLFFVAALELALSRKQARRVIQGIATFGVLASIYFTILQVFVINALCVYCMASAGLALLVFIAAIFLEPIRRDVPPPPAPPMPPPPAPRPPQYPSYLQMPPSA